MSQIFTYPSFLETREGGFLPTNDVLIEPRLRERLTRANRTRFDRIADRMSPDRLRTLAARRAAGPRRAPAPAE
ncbi:MAG: hypothetical protein ABW275_02500 [Hansschlegelia sp.]